MTCLLFRLMLKSLVVHLFQFLCLNRPESSVFDSINYKMIKKDRKKNTKKQVNYKRKLTDLFIICFQVNRI